MDVFSKRLKSYREKLKRQDPKWTQGYVAEKIGVARVTYTAYESGTKSPPLETVSRIADILEIDADYLLGRTDNPKSDKPKGSFFYFDKDAITEDDAELLEQSYKMMRERARKRAEEKKNKNNK